MMASSVSSSSATSMTTQFSFGNLGSAPEDAGSTMLVGKKEALKNLDVSSVLNLPVDSETVAAMLDSIRGPSGAASTFVGSAHQLHIAALPESVSRNNHPLSVHTVTDLVSKLPVGTSRLVFTGGPDVEASMGALTSAVAKAFPVYSRKTGTSSSSGTATKERKIHISFLDSSSSDGVSASNKDEEWAGAAAVCAGVQLATRLVDMPPAELTTTAYADECRRIAEELGDTVTFTEIVGDELNERGYGGLYGVGKAATCPPRLVILEYIPTADNNESTMETVALVGKGIVYDTGGLSLKSKDGMPGMKHDMGGSAGMLGGFYAAVQLKTRKRVVLILCLAENAIGPLAVRNDDILAMYSGKTVEINNTDAEGRLVLGDGVAHATKHIPNLDLVVDMATLTGAQLVTTGKKHAGILANSLELEQRAVKAGLYSGDLVYPMLYAPELLTKEFDSKVADMKNSVKDRGNAQGSCAGHFVEAHLDAKYEGGWLHVDMAGPATKDERGTGYGVGLVLALLEAPGF